MAPISRDIMVQRLFLQGLIRLLAVVSVLAAIYQALAWFTEGVRDGDLFDIFYYFYRIARGFFFVAIAVLLWVFAGLLSKLLIPFPKQLQCPRCSFLLRGLPTTRCPECGLALPANIEGEPGSSDHIEPPPRMPGHLH